MPSGPASGNIDRKKEARRLPGLDIATWRVFPQSYYIDRNPVFRSVDSCSLEPASSGVNDLDQFGGGRSAFSGKHELKAILMCRPELTPVNIETCVFR